MLTMSHIYVHNTAQCEVPQASHPAWPPARRPDRWTIPAAQEALKEEAKRLGLWNLWISPDLAAAMANGVPALQSDLARVERGDGGDGEAAEGRGEPWGGLLGAGLRREAAVMLAMPFKPSPSPPIL